MRRLDFSLACHPLPYVVDCCSVGKAAAAEKQKARKVMSKKVNRADKEFQELVDEMMADLVLQDMDAAGEAARRKAEEEHEASLGRYSRP